MKKLVISLLSLSALVVGCDNENYLLYDTDSKDKIFFVSDSLEFDYGFEQDKDVDFIVPAKVIGFRPAEDLEIKIEAISGTNTTKGTHYDIANAVLMKDSVNTVISLDFKLDAMTPDTKYIAKLSIVENDNFAPSYITTCTVVFSNSALTQPEWWDLSYLGDYTEAKHRSFVSYFWASEDMNALTFSRIAYTDGWGRNLDGENTDSYGTALLSYYYNEYFFFKYVLTPMYEDYLASGDAELKIPDPATVV